MKTKILQSFRYLLTFYVLILACVLLPIFYLYWPNHAAPLAYSLSSLSFAVIFGETIGINYKASNKPKYISNLFWLLLICFVISYVISFLVSLLVSHYRNKINFNEEIEFFAMSFLFASPIVFACIGIMIGNREKASFNELSFQWLNIKHLTFCFSFVIAEFIVTEIFHILVRIKLIREFTAIMLYLFVIIVPSSFFMIAWIKFSKNASRQHSIYRSFKK